MSNHTALEKLHIYMACPERRAFYILDRMRQCFGYSERVANRAFYLAQRVMAGEFCEVRTAIQMADVGDPALLVKLCKKSVPQGRIGYVYRAVCTDRPGETKIGFSLNPKIRAREISRRLSAPVEIISQAPGIMLDELVQHCSFIKCRTFGEWFLLDGAAA